MLVNVIPRIVPLVIIAAFWIPLLAHHLVWNETVGLSTVEKARQFPSDSILDEIQFFYAPNYDEEHLVQIAEKLSTGEADIPGLPGRTLTLPFSREDVATGSAKWQLALASFRIPLIFLSAFEITGEEIYLQKARDIIIEWAEFEKDLWLPEGFVRNDHAMAARIAVIAKFWKLYRNHRLYDAQSAKTIFDFLVRDARRLSNPEHFTFRSNHGLMQNIALLQLCVAYPDLPKTAQYKSTAIERLNDQFRYYISPEGVILEHSPGYHRDGIEFMSSVFRLLTLLEQKIPNDWIERYKKALFVYEQLRRPDGTLPMIGDTGGGDDTAGPEVCRFNANNECTQIVRRDDWHPGTGAYLYPVSGLANWWDDGSNGAADRSTPSIQTVITWANFEGHAHKHADELSMILWAEGHDWWTNIGYYPYGRKFRRQAVSWAGSNAPHLTEEVADGKRELRLNNYGVFQSLNFIELSRKTTAGFTANRQVIHLKENDIWMVLDTTQSMPNDTVRTIWTTSPEIGLTGNSDGGYLTLKPAGKDIALRTYIIPSAGGSVNVYKGSDKPFAGWVGEKPASAIVVDQKKTESWTLAVWYLVEQSALPADQPTRPEVVEFKNARQWSLDIPVRKNSIELERKDDKIRLMHVAAGSKDTRVFALSPPPDYRGEQQALEASFVEASRKYRTFSDKIEKRTKASLVILGLFLFQEIGWFVVVRKNKNHFRAAVLSVVVWGATFLFLNNYIAG